jgi:hypothetical protein
VTLAEVLGAAAESIGVAPTATGDGTTWAVGDVVIATLDGEGTAASFRLDPTLAAAALRTPDTRPSDRGPAWVIFEPRAIDPHAVDRATAWFEAAARRAGG